ncbi:TPA: hypothetical protein DEP96_03220 [Candidatus Uhrbacteria bacterium]|nr:hypothetical protein [Candidatus Uhrbacteria bacterium]
MEDDILSQRERVSTERVNKGRADLPGYRGEFEVIPDKKPTKQPYAEIAMARLEAAKARVIRQGIDQAPPGEAHRAEDTFDTGDLPTFSPAVEEKRVSKGIRGWWAKMFGGGE